MANKTELTRAIARRSRATIYPMTIEQSTTFMNLFIALVCEEMMRPAGRVELEGLFVMEQSGTSGKVRLSPALKRRMNEHLAKEHVDGR